MQGGRLGPYQLDQELGAGGMGKVYAATVVARAGELPVGTPVAIKIVHPHLLQTPGFFRRFLREADIGCRLRHDNVVRTYLADALTLDGTTHHFLVMERVEGQTLDALRLELERVPEQLCRHVAREVCKGLTAIHEASVVHRDLKPENVLITPDHHVKIMDLGVARLVDEAIRLSQSGLFVGSVDYGAPEQFRGSDVDARCDLHALGVLLYEIASGIHPYRGDDFRTVMHRVCDVQPRRLGQVNPQLSPFFEELVHTLLAKRPDDRFASAEVLSKVLDDGEDGPWWRERARRIRTETRRPLRRIRIPRETAVHGRDVELDRLMAEFREAAAGHGRVVLLEGEAGVGKSRMLDELVGRLQSANEDLNFLYGAYPPGGAATASGAFSTAYREHFGEDGSAGHLTQTPLLVSSFDALLRGDATPPGAVPLGKHSLQTCFVHATRALATQRPTIIAIDDLHFAPDEGIALFSALAMAVEEFRVLLVGSMRPGVDSKWISAVSRLPHVRHEILERLGPKDLAALLEDAFASKRLADQLGMQIARMSDGNPFFVFELLEGLRDGGMIERSADGSWISTRRIADLRVPSTVLDLVNARVLALETEERDLVDVAACCGYEFDPSLVGEALGLPRIEALRRFGRIERAHRLVRSSGRRMVFDHHQVQETLYDELHEQLREEYHAALAEALAARHNADETTPEELGGRLCVDLCDHYLLGGRATESARYVSAAARHLRRGHLHERAAQLFRRTLEVPGLMRGGDRVDLLLQNAGSLDLLARRDEQIAVCREAEALSRELGDRAREQLAAQALGTALTRVSDHDGAEAAMRRSLDLATELGDRSAEALTLGSLGHVARARGRLDEACALHEQHLAIARELGDLRSEGTATGNLGNVLYLQGRLADARAHHERDLEIARSTEDPRAEAIATGNVAAMFYSEGRLDEARDLFERQLELARDIGDRQSETRATGNLGAVLALQGRLVEASERFESDLALAREIGDRVSECFALQCLGDAALQLGDHEGARANLELAVERACAHGLSNRAARALALLGAALVAVGELDAGERRLMEALERSREMGAREQIVGALLELARLRSRRGDGDAAARNVEEARALLVDDESPELALLFAVCATHVLGEDPAAIESILDQHASRVGRAHRLRGHFQLWHSTGSMLHLVQARALVREHLAGVPEAHRKAARENVELHCDVLAAWDEHGDDTGPAVSESPTRAG